MVKILDQINCINNNICERLGEKNETQTSGKESLNNLKDSESVKIMSTEIPERPKTVTDKNNNVKSKEGGSGVHHTSKWSEKRKPKKVLMIGTSNIRFLSARYMAEKDKFVHKETQYSVKKANEFIKGYTQESPAASVLQVTCNDIESMCVEDILSGMNDLVENIRRKFGSEHKTVVSLPLPHRDNTINEKAKELSYRMMNKFDKQPGVICSDNTNLFYRGRPLQGILSDEKHLSRWGSTVLARNIQEELYHLFKF